MDLSGEPLFLERTMMDLNEEALQKRLTILGSCGFDSIPSDLGTQMLKNRFGGRLNQVDAYIQLFNDGQAFNYATWYALVEGYKNRDQLKSLRNKLFKQYYKPFQWKVKQGKCEETIENFVRFNSFIKTNQEE